MKKYLKVTKLLVLADDGIGACSHGRRMLTPKLFSGPRSCRLAFMMPGPAPVMTMKPALNDFLPKIRRFADTLLGGGGARRTKNRHLAGIW